MVRKTYRRRRHPIRRRRTIKRRRPANRLTLLKRRLGLI